MVMVEGLKMFRRNMQAGARNQLQSFIEQVINNDTWEILKCSSF